jgi:peroxiredoxin
VKSISGLFLILLLLTPVAGSTAPDVELKRLDGKSQNVSAYIGKGKWTIVAIWAHDCPICNAEIPAMAFFHDDHKDKDAIVLGVSVDGWANRHKAKQFIQTHALNFTNLIAEPRQEVLGRFGGGTFYGTPTFYVYSPTGELMARQVGPITIEAIEEYIQSIDRAQQEKNGVNG